MILQQEVNLYDEPQNCLIQTIEGDLYQESFGDDKPIDVDINTIQSYHQQWYQPNLAIICSEEFELKLPSIYPSINICEDVTIDQRAITFQKHQGRYFFGTNANWKVYYKLLFIRELLSTYTRYTYRYKDASTFDYPEIAQFMTWKHWVMAIPNSVCSNIPQNFFTRYQERFIRTFFKEYETSEYCYYNLIHQGRITKKALINYIRTISLDEIANILK